MLRQIFTPTYALPLPGTLKEKTNYLFKSYLLLLAILIGLGIVLKAIDIGLTDFFHIPSIIKSNRVSTDFTQTYGEVLGLLIITLVGPFLEELIFRLPLDLKRNSIAFSCAVITYRLVAVHIFRFNVQDLRSYLNILAAVIVFFIIKAALNQIAPFIERVKSKYYPRFFYLSAIIFGLIHISNYPLHGALSFIYILFVTPQLAMGFFFGNIRMRYGFIWGFFLHAMVNITFACPLILKALL